MLCDLAHPLTLHVLQGVAGVDGEAEHDDVRVGVGEGAQAVKLLLPGRIPQAELDVLPVDVDVVHVVLKDSRFVDLGEVPAVSVGPCQSATPV